MQAKIQHLLGERIRGAIRSKGYSQQKIAEELGISENGLTNYVKGRRVPDAVLIVQIAHLLDLNPSDLLDGLQEEAAGSTSSKGKATSTPLIRPEHVEEAYIILKHGLANHKLPLATEGYVLGVVSEWVAEGHQPEQIQKEFSELVAQVAKQRRLLRHPK